MNIQIILDNCNEKIADRGWSLLDASNWLEAGSKKSVIALNGEVRLVLLKV